MEKPVLLATSAKAETFGGVTYHLDGELVPALTVELSGASSVYFEHHILLWKHPSISISIKTMKGAMKRMMAGIQIFVTEAKGQGQIAFSRDGAGHIAAIHLKKGDELHVREHQFLAATGGIDYTFERVKGVANMLFGGTGFFIDKFRAVDAEGILWLHGYGNVFEKVLGGRGADRHRAGRMAVQGSRREDGNEYAAPLGGSPCGNEPRHEPIHRSRARSACSRCISTWKARSKAVKISEELQEFIKGKEGWIATASRDGTPNVSIKGSLRVLDGEHLVFADLSSLKTRKNLQENPKVAIMVYDPGSRRGYAFKGKAEQVDSGALFDQTVESIRKVMPQLPAPKYVVKVTVESIWDQSAGPGGGKQLA